MEYQLADLNWLAVIVAALAYFVLGAIWYARPVFGRIWMEAGGMEMPEGGGPGPAIFAVPGIASLLSAIVLGMLVQATGAEGVGDGVVLGAAIASGFVLPITMVTATFESGKPKPFTWGVVNAGYHVTGTLLAAIIVASWR